MENIHADIRVLRVNVRLLPSCSPSGVNDVCRSDRVPWNCRWNLPLVRHDVKHSKTQVRWTPRVTATSTENCAVLLTKGELPLPKANVCLSVNENPKLFKSNDLLRSCTETTYFRLLLRLQGWKWIKS